MIVASQRILMNAIQRKVLIQFLLRERRSGNRKPDGFWHHGRLFFAFLDSFAGLLFVIYGSLSARSSDWNILVHYHPCMHAIPTHGMA